MAVMRDVDTNGNDGRRPMFQMGVDTRLLYDRLQKVAVSETIDKAEMTKTIGQSVDRGHGYSALVSARRALQNDHGMVFEPVIGVGLKRLNDVEIVGTGERSRRRIRSEADRARRRLTTVNYDHLPHEHKVKHNAFLSSFGMLSLITKPSQHRALETRVSDAHKVLSAAQTLDSFRAQIAGKA